MKRVIAGTFIILSTHLSVGVACATDPPVIVTHKLAGSISETNETYLNFTVHVENPGDSAIFGLTLSFVPSPPFLMGRTTLKVNNLHPHQSVDLPLQLTAPASIPADEVSRRPLLWAGKCLDAQGQPVEFPATSHSGGVL